MLSFFGVLSLSLFAHLKEFFSSHDAQPVIKLQLCHKKNIDIFLQL